jgi:hypothetical protein
MKPARCNQCSLTKPPEAFLGPKLGKTYKVCAPCRAKYKNWRDKSPRQKLASMPERKSSERGDRVRLTILSHNKKTGPIPVSITESGSCPTSCLFNGAGCYAEYNHTRMHWNEVPKVGMEWEDFCSAIARLPRQQLWRHNEAGDLPGVGDTIDGPKLARLVSANRGRRGFTFTHKPVLRGRRAAVNRRAIAAANRNGFTVNLSADNLVLADKLANLGIAPVVVVLPRDTPDGAFRTPEGRQVVICPAERTDLQCNRCQLCQKAERKSIVGFRAHGNARVLVSELVKRIP